MLEGKNLKILGGEVDALIEQNTQINLLKQAMYEYNACFTLGLQYKMN